MKHGFSQRLNLIGHRTRLIHIPTAIHRIALSFEGTLGLQIYTYLPLVFVGT